MGAVGSDALFIDGTEFILNQLFGYQSAEAGRERGIRLRDGFQYQHAWDDTSTDDPGGGWAHAWPLGTHVGAIGWPTDPTQTQFYGDGSGIINIGSNGGMRNLCQAYSNPKNYLIAGVPGYGLEPGYNVNLTTLSSISIYARLSPGVWYTYLNCYSLMQDYRNIPPGGIYNTDAQGPVMPALYLSGDFTLHIIFMVFAHIYQYWTTPWGGNQLALIRPELHHQNGNIYTFASDDVTLVATDSPDSYGMHYWLCRWVGHISSFPAGVATLAFSCNGDWGANGPATISIDCVTNGLIRYVVPLLPSPNSSCSLKLPITLLGSGMKTTTPGVKYMGQGPDCFNKFVAYAV